MTRPAHVLADRDFGRHPIPFGTLLEVKIKMVSLAKSSSLKASSTLPTIASAPIRDAAFQEFGRGTADAARGTDTKDDFLIGQRRGDFSR